MISVNIFVYGTIPLTTQMNIDKELIFMINWNMKIPLRQVNIHVVTPSRHENNSILVNDNKTNIRHDE